MLNKTAKQISRLANSDLSNCRKTKDKKAIVWRILQLLLANFLINKKLVQNKLLYLGLINLN